jgi:hypothetical protein
MAEELTALWTAVSSTVEFTLGRSPDKTFRVEVGDEIVAKFWKLEEWRSQLKWPDARKCDLFLGPPFSWARLANHLDEAIGQLGAELAA